jgi:hypothetical protein
MLLGNGGIGPLCEQGCLEEDPNPTQPGIFLGSGVTPDLCFDPSMQTDFDADGLSEFCEKNIAAAFAPELAVAASDNTEREPRWVAQPGQTTSGLGVRVVYMLAYYVDNGPLVLCESDPLSEFFAGDGACDGHFGDSEAITLDIYYNPAWSHWVLDRAIYSKHETNNVYIRPPNKAYPTLLKYPGKSGGYPRSFVAYSKHANYASDAACDAGGVLGSDSCLADTFERVTAGEPLNVGSYAVPYADCVHSANPTMPPEEIECFWTFKRFAGWLGGEPDAGAYRARLADLGFAPGYPFF